MFGWVFIIFTIFRTLFGPFFERFPLRLSAIDKYVSVTAAPARAVGWLVCFTLPGMLYRKIEIDKVDLRKFSEDEYEEV